MDYNEKQSTIVERQHETYHNWRFLIKFLSITQSTQNILSTHFILRIKHNRLLIIRQNGLFERMPK